MCACGVVGVDVPARSVARLYYPLGAPGPRPESLVPRIAATTPIACWWGPEDQVTPLIGVVAQFFRRLPAERAATEFTLLPGTGHCPFDDRPDLASPALIAWLDREWPAARA